MSNDEKQEPLSPVAIPAAEMPKAIAEWNQPPVAEGKIGETIELAPGQLEPTPEAYRRAAVEQARWLKVDTERMTGVVPHLAEGGLQEHPVISCNGQVTGCPFFDPGDGLWGGVNLGDVVAFYPPSSSTWLSAIVLELRPDDNDGATARVVYFGGPSGMGVALVPHQSSRAPGGACWAHRTEEWTITGRIAAELKLGLGGSAFEEAKKLKAEEESARLLATEDVVVEEPQTPIEQHLAECKECHESGDHFVLCDVGVAIRLAGEEV